MYLCLIDWEVHLPSIYMHCPRSISGFSGMQDIYAWLTREGHMKCNGIQCIYAWLTGRSICLLYICIVLDLSVGLVVCKTSMLDWLGRATWSVMGIQCIYARLTGRSICLLYICIVLDLSVGLVLCKTSMLDWLGRATWSVMVFSIYACICAQLSGEGHMKCNGIQCIYAWLTGRSICLLYICIVLDLSVGLVVCKTSMLDWLGRATWSVMVFNVSMLDWLGGPSAFYIYALS